MNILIDLFYRAFLLSIVFGQVAHGWSVDQFGAIANEYSLEISLGNGLAFNKACAAANSSTDRTVLIPGGRFYSWLPAGTVSNLQNVTIIIDATVHAWQGERSDWPVNSKGEVLPLFDIQYTENLHITGSGLVNGHGYWWWWHVILSGEDNRPILLNLGHAINTLIDSVTFMNGPRFHLYLYDLLHATIQDMVIHVDYTNDRAFLHNLPTFPLNTDGIDIAGKDIYFRNLTIQNFDDAIAVKPTHVGSGLYTNCTQDILIEDSYVKYGVGMSIGSVPPNDNFNCVRNVTTRRVKFDNPLKAIYVKPNPGTHGRGIIQDIVYENIEVYNALGWAVWIGPQQQNQPGNGANTGCSFLYPLPGEKCPTDPLVTMDSIVLRNVSIYGGVFSPGVLLCNATNPCTNFLFENVNVFNRSHFPVVEGFYCENVSGFSKNSNLFPHCLTEISNSPKTISRFN